MAPRTKKVKEIIEDVKLLEGKDTKEIQEAIDELEDLLDEPTEKKFLGYDPLTGEPVYL